MLRQVCGVLEACMCRTLGTLVLLDHPSGSAVISRHFLQHYDDGLASMDMEERSNGLKALIRAYISWRRFNEIMFTLGYDSFSLLLWGDAS